MKLETLRNVFVALQWTGMERPIDWQVKMYFQGSHQILSMNELPRRLPRGLSLICTAWSKLSMAHSLHRQAVTMNQVMAVSLGARLKKTDAQFHSLATVVITLHRILH